MPFYLAGFVSGVVCSCLFLWLGGWRDLRKASRQFQEAEKRHVAAIDACEGLLRMRLRMRQENGAALARYARLANNKNSKDLKS